MRKILRIGIILLVSILFLYILLPNPGFPNPPADSLQSNEPGDTETNLRRAYFTNYSRQEVMDHYSKEFRGPNFLRFFFPSYTLNYPPEEAQTVIRDQTRSTFLEEIVHPLRESIYVNGFEPKDPKDAVIIEGKNWRQKITIRYSPSSIFVRIVAVLLIGTLTYLLTNEFILIIEGKPKKRLTKKNE